LEYVAHKGLSTAKCNPYGHGSGHDSLNYKKCPTACKGEGDLKNKVKAKPGQSYTYPQSTAEIQQ